MKDMIELPLIGREASVMVDTIDSENRTVDIVWTTGATVQRAEWVGWDDVVFYDEELVVDQKAIRMDRINNGAPFLNSHRSWGLESVLGTVVEGSVRIEGGQGTATIKLTSAPDAADIVHRILEKTVRHVSVGYRVHEYQKTARDGERELWKAVDWEPMEISAVAMPADAGAVIRSENGDGKPPLYKCVIRHAETAAPAASTKGKTMKDDKKAGGDTKSRKDDDKDVKTTDTPKVDDKQRSAPDAPKTTDAPAADAVRNQTASDGAEILSLVERHNLPMSFARSLIADDVTIDKARSMVLDKLASGDSKGGRTTEGNFAQVRGDGETDQQRAEAITNALMHRHDPANNELSADGRQFRGMTLMELGRDALDREGISTRGMGKMEVARLALQSRGAGYHSTADFPAILANVTNKTLRDAYERTPMTFTGWARRSTITDFREKQVTQLGGAPDLLRVPESGEFKYGTMGEGKEVYALVTYGRIIGITRQTLINDDLDAFTRIPAAFGASAADLESDLVYSILKSNPVMGDGVNLFDAAHGNIGVAAPINEDSLSLMYRSFGNQRGLEGRQIAITPSYLIVPPGTRSVQARKNVTQTTPDSVAGVNPHAGRLEVVEEARLIAASGADPWFAAASPMRIDTVEYAYLDGNEGIFTETRTGFEVDGIEVKARHDFAAKAIDHRGLYSNAGT